MIPQAARELMAQPPEIIEVVHAYLDAGCSVAETAAALHLHRTTVYYRLNRLEEHTGIDLADGSTRLLLHLWLKARQLSVVVD
jgi:DNA-binding PucR family transcriptional regulator